jgi:hypothetical protein
MKQNMNSRHNREEERHGEKRDPELSRPGKFDYINSDMPLKPKTLIFVTYNFYQNNEECKLLSK